jgi:hypothetical protein
VHVADEVSEGYDPRLLGLAAVAGMASMAALPLSITPWGNVLLAFALPLTLALVGRMRARLWLINLGFVLLVLIGAIVVLQLEALGLVGALVLFVGPVVAAVLVGLPLREFDLVASGAYLMGGTIAIVAGFLITAIDPQAAAAVIVAVAITSSTVVVVRVRSTVAAAG